MAAVPGPVRCRAVTSSRRSKECEISSYRHGCDPPKRIQLLLPRTARISARPPALKQSLIRLIELQPSCFDFIKIKHLNFERMDLSKIVENFGKACERLLGGITLDRTLTAEELVFVRYYCNQLLEKSAQRPSGPGQGT